MPRNSIGAILTKSLTPADQLSCGWLRRTLSKTEQCGTNQQNRNTDLELRRQDSGIRIMQRAAGTPLRNSSMVMLNLLVQITSLPPTADGTTANPFCVTTHHLLSMGLPLPPKHVTWGACCIQMHVSENRCRGFTSDVIVLFPRRPLVFCDTISGGGVVSGKLRPTGLSAAEN